ncbi:ABC transporter ATP-binding protein [Aminobacter sp. AP02]|uniref:ABC transporter ATP-binding protein n=1 Tax=Aminobacter sp. AP02 TaxID=2135737 RepID=UPI000D6C9AE0|nr:ABC transporter ATP-binding protein [Aminobacter sp. AP02]PWK66394.1 NitT/TauT family transport system ATP-binding protein [Aminobacter sp. AP02]
MLAVHEALQPLPAEAVPPAIEVNHLTKAFYDSEGDRVTVAVSDVSFTVARGEFVCIVGPSGCGKTTVLRILADLEEQLGGTVKLNSATPPAMVFQEASVLPWLTVAENIAFPLSLKGVSRVEQDARVRELLALTGLTDFAKARPHQLSGGMKQRVSVARALVDDRDILLMDEPFGALDEQTRLVLQQELLRIWETTGKTVVFITHSVDEALTLADRVIVMSPRPGTLVANLTVPFERPRDVVEMRRDKRFWDMTYEVWRLLASPVGA